jgi:hypothetical protein
VCTSNVEIVEDNDDVEDQFLEERFEQFAMALAFNDDEMAEKALQEMGYIIFCADIKHIPQFLIIFVVASCTVKTLNSQSC